MKSQNNHTNHPLAVSPPGHSRVSQGPGGRHGSAVTGPASMHAGERRVVGLILDRSPSMEWLQQGRRKMDIAIESAVRTAASLYRQDPCIEVFVIQFDGGADIVVPPTPLNQDYDGIVTKIQGITIGCNTDQGAGMGLGEQVIMPLVKEGRASANIVFMTDGNGGNPLPAANRLKAAGVVIGVTGFGTDPGDVNETLLRQVASESGGQPLYQFASSQSKLTTSMVSQAHAHR